MLLQGILTFVKYANSLRYDDQSRFLYGYTLKPSVHARCGNTLSRTTNILSNVLTAVTLGSILSLAGPSCTPLHVREEVRSCDRINRSNSFSISPVWQVISRASTQRNFHTRLDNILRWFTGVEEAVVTTCIYIGKNVPEDYRHGTSATKPTFA